MKTYNNIIDALHTFCSNHYQINTFYSGDTWDFQAKSNIYPAVIVLPQPSTIDKGRINIKFNLFVADLMNKDCTNLDEIYSDTLLIMTDIVSYFRNYEEDGYAILDDSINIEPFNEKFDDNLGGWMATLTFEIPYVGSTCGLPLAIT